MEKEQPLPPPLYESNIIPLNKVKLQREWTFWENYMPKDKNDKKDYSYLLNEVFSFNTIIDFWQFWNAYQGIRPQDVFFNGERIRYFFKEKYRIISLNFFEKGIKPEWEDPKNKGGTIFLMEYTLFHAEDYEDFFKSAQKSWTTMILSVLGEVALLSKYITGIRFVDKSSLNMKTIFRFEIWFCKGPDKKELEEAKKEYGMLYGCEGIIMKPIP